MQFTANNKASWSSVLEYIGKLPNKAYDVSITLHHNKRSKSQNAMYWAWVGCIASETGNSTEDIHDAMRQKFLPFSHSTVLNGVIHHYTSSSSLDTAQFTEYMKSVEAFAASELGIVLPHPEDAYYNDFYKRYGRL